MLNDPSTLVLLLGAAFMAGTLNAVAGGGSFLTLPALAFTGMPPVAANATGTVALLKQHASSFISEVDFVQMQATAIAKLVDLLNFNALFAENDAQPCNAPDLAHKAAQGR